MRQASPIRDAGDASEAQPGVDAAHKMQEQPDRMDGGQSSMTIEIRTSGQQRAGETLGMFLEKAAGRM